MRTFRIKNIGYGILAVVMALMTTVSINANYTNKVSAAVPGVNELISKDASGTIGNSRSQWGDGVAPAMSHDGRYVAFGSDATNLVPNDTNGYSDVFVKDTQTGAVARASVLPSGAQFTNNTYVRDMTYDGRYVLFALMPQGGLFLRDTVNNTTTSVFSQNGGPCQAYGVQGGAVSADGRYVTFTDMSYPGNPYQAVVKDMVTGTCKVLSADASGNVGNANSYPGDISCDGGIITFYTSAGNLSGTGGYIARFDISGNLQLTRVSAMKNAGTVSCNGNMIASWDTTYGSANKIDRLTGQVTSLVAQPHSILGYSADTRSVSLSDDGRYAAVVTNTELDPSYPNTGAYNHDDTYIVDTKNSTSQLLSFTVAGNKSGSVDGLASISADGNKVAYSYNTPSSTDTTHELISGLTVPSYRMDVYTSETSF
jgi:hypothetical protein